MTALPFDAVLCDFDGLVHLPSRSALGLIAVCSSMTRLAMSPLPELPA